MNKKRILVCIIGVCLTFLLVNPNSLSFAEVLEGRLGVGLRMGPSFLVEPLSDQYRGEGGPVFNGAVFYGLTNRVLAGFHLEWEKHTVTNNASSFVYGEQSTVSIIPAMEYHLRAEGPFSPYGILGIGINLNRFNRSNDLGTLCASCQIEPKNTLALKGGLGIDYFRTSFIVYNAEFALKMNDGNSDFTGVIPGFGSDTSTDNRNCVFTLVFGVRRYY